jgi:hypothetical protein
VTIPPSACQKPTIQEGGAHLRCEMRSWLCKRTKFRVHFVRKKGWVFWCQMHRQPGKPAGNASSSAPRVDGEYESPRMLRMAASLSSCGYSSYDWVRNPNACLRDTVRSEQRTCQVIEGRFDETSASRAKWFQIWVMADVGRYYRPLHRGFDSRNAPYRLCFRIGVSGFSAHLRHWLLCEKPTDRCANDNLPCRPAVVLACR